MLDATLLARLGQLRPITGDLVTIRTCEGLALAEVLGRVPSEYGFDNDPDQVEAFRVRSIDMPERVGTFVWAPVAQVVGNFDVVDTNWAVRVLAAIVPACRVAHQKRTQDAFNRLPLVIAELRREGFDGSASDPACTEFVPEHVEVAK
jgi:hypothetical protein